MKEYKHEDPNNILDQKLLKTLSETLLVNNPNHGKIFEICSQISNQADLDLLKKYNNPNSYITTKPKDKDVKNIKEFFKQDEKLFTYFIYNFFKYPLTIEAPFVGETRYYEVNKENAEQIIRNLYRISKIKSDIQGNIQGNIQEKQNEMQNQPNADIEFGALGLTSANKTENQNLKSLNSL